jgi:UDP-N-acetylmuramoyl-tripeptide--D-alanyl-D-alanine ligase
MNLDGMHYVSDSLAAVAVALEMGVKPEDIKDRLSSFSNMEGRQSIYEAKGFTIINDSYNAGPESMTAALNVLGNKNGRRIAVLGDMLELGVNAQAEHYKIGRIAAEKADLLFAFGPTSERMLNGAVTGGMVGKARAFTDRERLVQALKLAARPGDILLFKGSRGMRMELILEAFLK